MGLWVYLVWSAKKKVFLSTLTRGLALASPRELSLGPPGATHLPNSRCLPLAHRPPPSRTRPPTCWNISQALYIKQQSTLVPTLPPSYLSLASGPASSSLSTCPETETPCSKHANREHQHKLRLGSQRSPGRLRLTSTTRRQTRSAGPAAGRTRAQQAATSAGEGKSSASCPRGESVRLRAENGLTWPVLACCDEEVPAPALPSVALAEFADSGVVAGEHTARRQSWKKREMKAAVDSARPSVHCSHAR